jgi:hypothetical protein
MKVAGMSYVIADPEIMTAAASDLASIGSNLNAAHMVAAARTTSVIPAGADEVSASIAHLFSQQAASYQALAGQAAAFQEQFVQHLTAGAFSYASIEATIASFLQNLQNLPNVLADYLAVPFPGEAALASLLQGLNANASSFGSALEGQILNSLSALTGIPPGQILDDAPGIFYIASSILLSPIIVASLILLSPIIVPATVFTVLYFLYLLDTGQIQIMLGIY